MCAKLACDRGNMSNPAILAGFFVRQTDLAVHDVARNAIERTRLAPALHDSGDHLDGGAATVGGAFRSGGPLCTRSF